VAGEAQAPRKITDKIAKTETDFLRLILPPCSKPIGNKKRWQP
jgi:hypothetical protein